MPKIVPGETAFLVKRMTRIIFCVLLVSIGSPVFSEPLILNQLEQENLGLKLAPAKAVSITSSQSFPANVIIPNNARNSVHSPQEGIVLNLFKAVGDTVSRGELVAVVNSLSLITVQRDYLQSHGRLKQIEVEWRRLKQLYAEGIVAERRYQEIASQRQLAINEYQALAQQLQLMGLSQAQLDELRSSGQYTSELQLHSETDGVVMQQQVTTGQRVTAMDSIYMIADLSTLWLEVHVPLDVARQINPGKQAGVDDREVNGTVSAVGREVHEIDRGVMVRVLVEHNTDLLTPGEFVQVKFYESASAPRYEIPIAAILNLDGRPHIFVKTASGFSPVPVVVYSQRKDTAIIEVNENGLDKVVVAGVAALKAAWNSR
jgi:multidrug efflux pump subunit AcrA (membrane-fusion protein)